MALSAALEHAEGTIKVARAHRLERSVNRYVSLIKSTVLSKIESMVGSHRRSVCEGTVAETAAPQSNQLPEETLSQVLVLLSTGEAFGASLAHMESKDGDALQQARARFRYEEWRQTLYSPAVVKHLRMLVRLTFGALSSGAARTARRQFQTLFPQSKLVARLQGVESAVDKAEVDVHMQIAECAASISCNGSSGERVSHRRLEGALAKLIEALTSLAVAKAECTRETMSQVIVLIVAEMGRASHAFDHVISHVCAVLNGRLIAAVGRVLAVRSTQGLAGGSPAKTDPPTNPETEGGALAELDALVTRLAQLHHLADSAFGVLAQLHGSGHGGACVKFPPALLSKGTCMASILHGDLLGWALEPSGAEPPSNEPVLCYTLLLENACEGTTKDEVKTPPGGGSADRSDVGERRSDVGERRLFSIALPFSPYGCTAGTVLQAHVTITKPDTSPNGVGTCAIHTLVSAHRDWSAAVRWRLISGSGSGSVSTSASASASSSGGSGGCVGGGGGDGDGDGCFFVLEVLGHGLVAFSAVEGDGTAHPGLTSAHSGSALTDAPVGNATQLYASMVAGSLRLRVGGDGSSSKYACVV
jgi:uncharacterized membrane protein YgcG